MSELVSLLIGTAVLYVAFLQIREYDRLTRNSFRFRLFALRDELAMLVLAGKIKEDSWEYVHIIDTLNFHISAVESMSVTRMVNTLVKFHTSSKEGKQVERLTREIDQKEVAQILVAFMSTTYDLINRNSRVQIFLIRTAARLFKIANPPKQAGQSVVPDPRGALSAINAHREVLQASLKAA